MDLDSKLFADDTTFYNSGYNLDELITSFKKKLEPLIEWCRLNRLDINLRKTYCMIVTRRTNILFHLYQRQFHLIILKITF